MKKIKGKIAVIGNPAIGKSTILQLFTTNQYIKDYIMTQGAEVFSKIIPFESEDKDVELFFIDIGGQEVYKSMYEDLLKDTDLIMACFDCTNSDSFHSLQNWINLANKVNGKDLTGIVVSLKNDLKILKCIEIGEGNEFSKKNKLDFFETSSARNMDIEQPFLNLAEKILKLKKFK